MVPAQTGELHKGQGQLNYWTFHRLGLSLAVDDSEDAALSIRDLITL